MGVHTYFTRLEQQSQPQVLADISIDTSSPVSFDTVFSMSMVASFYKGKASNGNYRVMTSQPYLGLVEDFGGGALTFPAVGQIANVTHNLQGSGGGNEYNFDPADFPEPNGETVEEYQDGVYTINWGHDFNTDANNLYLATGRDCHYCANPRYGSYNETIYIINNFPVTRVIFGAELQTFENESWDRNDYKDTVNTWLASLASDAPDVITCVNGGLIYKTNPTTVNWIAATKTIATDEVSNYWQLGDRITFSSDNASNLQKILVYFNQTLPTDMANLISSSNYSGKRIYIGEMNIEDNESGSTQFVNNKMLGLFSIAKYYEYAINNTTTISGVTWESQKNLIDSNDVADNNYYVMKMLNGIPSVSVGTIDFGVIPNISGSITFSGGNYKMLINNWGDGDVLIPLININGVPIGKTFINNYVYANDWSDTPIFGTETGILLTARKHSVNVVRF